MLMYKHKKTGNIYRYLAQGIDCTNERDGTPVVVYCPNDKENTVFVRSALEFDEKFEEVK